MKTTRTDSRIRWNLPLFALAALLVGGLLAGCGGGDGTPTGDDAAMNERAGEESAGGVEYEPAYPEDVSAEALSDEDTAQQEAHTHADGSTHSHGEEDDHEHDGDDDHDH